MKLIKGGLIAAVLSLFALTFASSSALADPIGSNPFTGNGTIRLDGGLGGSDCSSLSVAGPNGGTITAATFSGCTGAAGTPTALPNWTVTWNARNDGGRINVSALANVSGLAQCLYRGDVNFTYNTTTKALTIVSSTVPLVTQLGGLPICPSSVVATGGLTLSY